MRRARLFAARPRRRKRAMISNRSPCWCVQHAQRPTTMRGRDHRRSPIFFRHALAMSMRYSRIVVAS
jgi:hypothetical protein